MPLLPHVNYNKVSTGNEARYCYHFMYAFMSCIRAHFHSDPTVWRARLSSPAVDRKTTSESFEPVQEATSLLR